MSNQKTGIRVNPEEEMRKFDLMPPSIREVLARAPFKYAVSPWAKEWRRIRQGGGDYAAQLKTFRAMMIGWITDDLQRDAYRTYGPDHPDAARNRITGRALDNPPKWRGLE